MTVASTRKLPQDLFPETYTPPRDSADLSSTCKTNLNDKLRSKVDNSKWARAFGLFMFLKVSSKTVNLNDCLDLDQ